MPKRDGGMWRQGSGMHRCQREQEHMHRDENAKDMARERERERDFT